VQNYNGGRRITRTTRRVKYLTIKRPVVKYICGRIYLGADDVEGLPGSGAGWVGDEIEEATRLASRGRKRYTLAINTNTDLDRWAMV
jgi:hypothetical protein